MEKMTRQTFGGIVDKKRVARLFSASLTTYETHAAVQRRLVELLANKIAGYGKNWRRGLEIGCGTGYLSRELVQRVSLEELYVNDISAELCSHTAEQLAAKYQLKVEMLAGDIEALALPAELDLIVSSSTFQWLEDLEGLFARVANTLSKSHNSHKNGLFAFTIFGEGTMAEVTALSGRGLQYKSFAKISQLVEKYFVIEQRVEIEDTLFFPSALALFKHIRNTGVGGLGQTRWTRAGLRDFEARYFRDFGTEKGLPVSYCAYIFLASCNKEYL